MGCFSKVDCTYDTKPTKAIVLLGSIVFQTNLYSIHHTRDSDPAETLFHDNFH